MSGGARGEMVPGERERLPRPPVLRLAAVLCLLAGPAAAQRWATVWSGPDQGPYPVGDASAQPDLSAAFPQAEGGSHEQSFRLIIKPDVFGRTMRFRFSNSFGAKPVTFDTAYAGLQMSGAAVAAGTNRGVTFGGGKRSVTVAPGAQVWSDAVTLPFVHEGEMDGRKLAVTFHVPGDSGPMTWHAKAMTTSYVTARDAGAVGGLEDEGAFPVSTTSWYFLDAADAMLPGDTKVIVCLGDSITDGTASTLNGDDRWTDVMSRRLHAAGGHVAVVNAGIGGNQVLGPAEYATGTAFAGGPSAAARLERDVLGLSGVADVVVFEGINDLAAGAAGADAVMGGLRGVSDRVRARVRGVKIIGATVTSSRGSMTPGYGTVDLDGRRHALNELIRAGFPDGVIDFDAATADPATGELRPEFVPSSTFGGAGDRLHPNRAGYQAMGNAVDLRMLAPPEPPKPKPRPRPKPVEAPDAADTAAAQ